MRIVKYALLNIKSSISKETMVFFTMVISIILSSLAVFFSFGLYHHLEQVENDKKSASRCINIIFQDIYENTVTKKQVVDKLLSNEMYYDENMVFTLDMVDPEADWPREVVENTYYFTSIAAFRVDKDGVHIPNSEWIKRVTTVGTVWFGGEWFSEEQFVNGEHVCIGNPEKVTAAIGIMGREEQNYLDMEMFEKKEDEDGYYEIKGEKYKTIGYIGLGSNIPLIPLCCTSDNSMCKGLEISFAKNVTINQYQNVKNDFESSFGNAVEVFELELVEADYEKFNKTISIITVILIFMSGITLEMLDEYILLRRKKRIQIMRLCGVSKAKTVVISVVELLFVIIPSYVVAVLIYNSILLAWLSDFYEYIKKPFSLNIYLKFGIIFVFGTTVITMIMTTMRVNKSITKEI